MQIIYSWSFDLSFFLTFPLFCIIIVFICRLFYFVDGASKWETAKQAGATAAPCSVSLQKQKASKAFEEVSKSFNSSCAEICSYKKLFHFFNLTQDCSLLSTNPLSHIDVRWFFRCTVDLEKVMKTLEDQELKENVEVMKNLQNIILELKVWMSSYITIQSKKYKSSNNRVNWCFFFK